MSDPTPVTTRIITADKGSSRNVNATLKSPEVIQVNARSAIARASGSMPTSRQTESAETKNDPIMAPHATAPDTDFVSRRPTPAFTRNPRKGRSGISSSMPPPQPWNAKAAKSAKKRLALRALRALCSTSSSPFQRRPGVGVQRFLVAEERDDDRQTDGRFRRRHGHHEEHDDLPVGRSERAPERDERQVHRVQHDLDRQENRDQVAPDEHTRGADREQ